MTLWRSQLKPICSELCIRIVSKVCWIQKLANSWAGLSEKLERKLFHITPSTILHTYTLCQQKYPLYGFLCNDDINQNSHENIWTHSMTPKTIYFHMIEPFAIRVYFHILFRLQYFTLCVVFSMSAYDMISQRWGHTLLVLA